MKKGFTLVEVLAVLAIIGIIALIAYPQVDKAIKQSREKAYEENVRTIESQALTYSTDHDLGYSTSYQTLQLSVLKNAGLLKDDDIRNPIDGSTMGGCVLYKWVTAKNQYEFQYSSTCTIPD